jgi:formate dehydrogenase gamma subunit
MKFPVICGGSNLNESILNRGKIEKYDKSLVLSHWLMIILVLLLLITGGLPFYNWFTLEMTLYNAELPELPYSLQMHSIIGVIFVFMTFYYLLTFLKRDDQNIITQEPGIDVRSFYNSFSYIIGLKKRKEVGEGEKYHRSQKILFLLFVYTIGLMIISGIILFILSLTTGELVEPSLDNGIFLTHILTMFIFIILTFFFIGLLLRKLDGVAIKSILVTGKVPLWYIKKNHKQWYFKLSEGKRPKKRYESELK